MLNFSRIWTEENVYDELTLWISALKSMICANGNIDALAGSYNMRLRRIRHTRVRIEKEVGKTLLHREGFQLETVEMQRRIER
jgi:hypothetical protein